MNVRSVVKKPLSFFKRDNIRKQFNEAELRELGESIKKRLLHPIVAQSDGTIIDGERRWRAALIVEMKEIDTIIIDEPMTKSELRLLQAATVFHTSDWTAGEKYDFVYEQVQLNPTWQAKEVAEHLHVDPATLSKLLTFSKTIPAVREALKEGKIGVDDGYALSQLPEADQAELLAARLTREIPNREDLQRAVKARKNPMVETQRVSRFKADISGMVVTVAGEALEMTALIGVLSSLLKLAKLAKKKPQSMPTFEAELRDKVNGEEAV